jgi:hypothetical protein
MAIVKGSKAIQLIRKEYRWDPQQNAAMMESEYQGSTLSAIGFYNKNIGGQSNVSVTMDGGVGRVLIQSPTSSKTSGVDDYVERYEVGVEFVEKDIFQVPAIAQEAREYDTMLDQLGDVESPYYRQLAEDVATNKGNKPNASIYPLFEKVVRYLRDGVTGYELEYVVIRRSRKIPRGSSNVAAIGDGLLVYSTAQLGLPDDIAFSVPDSSALTPISSDYIWGWRRRPSTSSVEGMYIDQNSEFILSQWSSLFYTASTTEAAW